MCRCTAYRATLAIGVFVLVAASSTAAPVSAQTSGTWTLTGSMTTKRPYDTATVLQTGQVLVAGGAVASAELYNPATGRWSATGSMSTPRMGVGLHTILLPNGKALVTGGSATGLFAELYDPSTGQWSSANAPACISVCRLDASATLLNTGNVLFAGGFVGNYPDRVSTVSALLYNPSTNSWTSTGSLNVSRAEQMASLLPDGQVLVAGGDNETKDSFTVLTSAELYTP